MATAENRYWNTEREWERRQQEQEEQRPLKDFMRDENE